MTHKTIVVALAVSLAGTTVATQAKAEKPREAAAAQEHVYCLQYEGLVGSRIKKSECMTKKQWAKHGVDIDEILKGNQE